MKEKSMNHKGTKTQTIIEGFYYLFFVPLCLGGDTFSYCRVLSLWGFRKIIHPQITQLG
jgi:hypothetical protein